MKIAILLCCLCLEAWAQGNARATIRMEPPAPAAQPRRFYAPRARGLYFGATLPEQTPAPSPVTLEKEAPRYIINKDFVRERLSPQTSLLGDSVRPPASTRPPAQVQAHCRLKMKDGEAIEATSCWMREDVIGFVNSKGRAVRVSQDLVEQGPY
jgi:hypothetical protein